MREKEKAHPQQITGCQFFILEPPVLTVAVTKLQSWFVSTVNVDLLEPSWSLSCRAATPYFTLPLSFACARQVRRVGELVQPPGVSALHDLPVRHMAALTPILIGFPGCLVRCDSVRAPQRSVESFLIISAVTKLSTGLFVLKVACHSTLP